MAKKKPGDQQPQANIVTSDPDAIRLLNLDQIQSTSSRAVRLQIGYATFYLDGKDVAALIRRLAAPNRNIVIAKCHFVLSDEGRTLLQKVLEQAFHAKTNCTQQQQQKEQEQIRRQQIEAEWLRHLRCQ
jgi:hypothetical protein